ncbi:MAG TPA: hypothetical protein VE011_06570 [Candidatus Dormibacteraeota bacterium]|nr:hypothetical protein [Candidatus Dormibacteraeota bacterium]
MPRSTLRSLTRPGTPRSVAALLPALLLIAGCSATASPSPASTPSSAAATPADSLAPETGVGTTSGDIPDNAVFLAYHGVNPAFSIQYVEGWQVSPQPDGVVVRDKDSSETVQVRPATSDVAGYVAATDLPALTAMAGFQLITQDTVTVGSTTYVHLAYHLPASPDPVTGKQVPSTVDRYYVPGSAGLAVVSLSTPDGVDNIDAFRQMIQSFHWS